VTPEVTVIPLFKRKTAAEDAENICPYCEFVNQAGATICAQCYYELNKSPRDQGEIISKELSDNIFDELMSDEDDSWEEGEAVDVVLKLDEDPLEINQYEVTDFSSEEPEEISFVESKTPQMNDVVSHQVQEVSIEDIGKAPKDVEKIDFSGYDPLSDVKDPIPNGRGNLFSPSTPKIDDDLTGHIGGTELPSLPPDDLYENRVDLTVQKAPAPTPAVVLPQLPTNTEVEVKQDEIVEEEVEETPPQLPVINENRIWPWAFAEEWDPRKIHREVVSALEQIKSGKLEEATLTIDSLGPHLTHENIDMIYHIGMILKQIGRNDETRDMISRASSIMPDNEHVLSAKTHLEV